MFWIIFFIFIVLVSLLFTSVKEWRFLWIAGIIALIVLYAIDSTLVALGAFSYSHTGILIGGLPLLYWISGFFGGIFLVYHYPKKNILKLPYILISSFIFLLMELTVEFFGYFHYHNWSPQKSFFLDIFGFTVVTSLWNLIGSFRKIKNL